MISVTVPFFSINPKTYLWGARSLDLAVASDEAARDSGISVFFSCPFPDIRLIKENTKHLIVTAQHMEPLTPGRGMGHILPESLKEAGADAVFLNHAENPMTLADLSKAIIRARELELFTIVCADSVKEAAAVSLLDPDMVLAEPTDLIGTGQAADDSYIMDTVDRIRRINPRTLIMIASGISSPEDVYNVVLKGADGTGATSGIVKASSPAEMTREMIFAAIRGFRDRTVSE